MYQSLAEKKGKAYKVEKQGKCMELPKLVAALNLSPESFYVGSRVTGLVAAEKMRKAIHASIVDIGAKSTRPPHLYGGEEEISPEEELRRLEAAVDLIVPLAKELGKQLSIDTQSAKVAEYALEVGFTMVNDISGLKADPDMPELVSRYDADLVVMATRQRPGDCRTMDEIMTALEESIDLALAHGIKREKISVDPGFGGWQGKGSDCDMDIIRNFARLKDLKLPIYVAVSRKSTIQALGGARDPEDRLPGSLAMAIWLAEQGVDYIRTHDVEKTYRALKVWKQITSLDRGGEEI